MLNVGDFFLLCFYILFGAVVFALCITIVGAAIVEIRKRWRG